MSDAALQLHEIEATEPLDAREWRVLWTLLGQPYLLPKWLFLQMPEEVFDHVEERKLRRKAGTVQTKIASFRRVRVADEDGNELLSLQRFVYKKTKVRFDVDTPGSPGRRTTRDTFEEAKEVARQIIRADDRWRRA